MTSETKRARERAEKSEKKRQAWADKLKKLNNKYEAVLWEYLKGCQMGVNFRRQIALGDTKYVADFYCSQLMLDIEVDGGIHKTPDKQQRDQRRDAKLEHLGIQVFRIPTEALKTKSIKKTLHRIRAVVEERQIEQLGGVIE